MTKESFEKAKFGDRFVTRGGQEALFLRLTENSEWQFADFYVKDWGFIRVNRENGKRPNGPDTENDIVGIMPSLPSDMDEAAQKVEDYYDVGEEHGYLCCHRGDIKDTFKAGAEWMAGQGETHEIEIVSRVTGKGLLPAITCLVDKNFNEGDKVVVQIRKKYLFNNTMKEKQEIIDEKPKTQTINLSEAKRFCRGLSMLAKECKMDSIDYTMLGIKTLHFADGSSIGGLRAYIDAGLITKI